MLGVQGDTGQSKWPLCWFGWDGVNIHRKLGEVSERLRGPVCCLGINRDTIVHHTLLTKGFEVNFGDL